MLLALDLVVVVVFVLIGRATHEEGVLAVGTLVALWPFVLALLIGWLVTARRLPPRSLRAGALIWAVTVLLGLGLRALTGQGTALPFIVVATLVLGAGLLGWRLIGILLRHGHARGEPDRGGRAIG